MNYGIIDYHHAGHHRCFTDVRDHDLQQPGFPEARSIKVLVEYRCTAEATP